MFRGKKRFKNPNQKNSILDILEDFIRVDILSHSVECRVGFSLLPENQNKRVVPLYV